MTATAQLAGFGANHADFSAAVEQAATRHLIDTVGVIVAGIGQGVAAKLGPLLPNGDLPLPGRHQSDLAGYTGGLFAADHAYLCGTAAHGLELDDGYREGSVHPGVAVVPALIVAAQLRPVSGRKLLEALAIGYEGICTLAGGLHPALRDRGFHPTAAVGPLGAALAVSRVMGLDAETTQTALGLAASEAGGLFAFLGGGGEVKRLHGGLAARAGLMAARLAQTGVSAPAGILERQSGYAQAFGGVAAGDFSLTLPPLADWRMVGCYIKPHACCRHLQPALEALIALRKAHDLTPENVERIEVETYSIAAAHRETGWDDMATAQLSFPYVLAQGLWKGRAALGDFDENARREPHANSLIARLNIHASEEMDALYPAQRPARVRVHARGQLHTLFAPEASGSPDFPASDAAISNKFLDLVAPILGIDKANSWLAALWAIADQEDAAPILIGPGVG